MHRWLRVLICLLLVCCLLVRISPIQAKAVGLSGTVATGTAIAAGLVALGISVGATETAFNNLVDSLTAVAGSDRVPVWISETADGFVTYLQKSFLGSLLAHCFDTGVLSESQNLPSVPSYLSESLSEAALAPYAALIYWPGSSSEYTVLKSDYPLYIKTDTGVGGRYALVPEGYKTSLNYTRADYQGWYTASNVLYDPAVCTISYFGSNSEVISTSQDLTLGSVGATMSAPNYDPWRSNAIPVVPPIVGGGTAEEEEALPVTFPGLDTPSITGQTQAGAQSGITPGTVVEDILSGGEVVPDTGTGTIADVIAAIKAIPASLADFFADVVAAVQAIPAAIADVFTPSADIGHFSLSLSDYFPFCIPFDLYDFVTCLNADPVAPVIDWEIYLPGGETYPLQVDLSPFDQVARILRTLQLLLFCIGLATKTRDLIKG